MTEPTKHVSTRRRRLATLQYRRAVEATNLPLRRPIDHRAAEGNALTRLITSTRMNRMTAYFEKPPEDEYGDFFVVAGDFGAACVTSETATQIEAVLDRTQVPTWIVFDDRAGSRLRVRTRQIRSIGESTAAQRAEDRRIDRARQREEKDDHRPWEGND